MQDKKIRFSAEENIRPVLRGLSEESSKLGRKLIEDARAYTTSSKETLKYIEEQIRAKERLIALESKGARVELEKAYGRGDIKKAEYSREKTEIGLTDKYAQQQTGLLRELINTIKNESQKEIREDRKGVEQTIKASKTVEQLGPRGDAARNLKDTLQKDEINRLKDEEGRGRGFDRAGAELRATRLIDGVRNVASSQNAYEATGTGFGEIAKGVATKLPVVGAILALGAAYTTKAITASVPYEDALAGVSQITGRRQQNYYGRFGDLTDFGIAPDEAVRLATQTARKRGSFKGAIEASKDVAIFNKATGVSRDIFFEQEELTRAGGLGTRAGTQGLVKGLQGIGAIKGQDMSLLGEYLPILIGLQREQVKITGETNTEIATKLVTGIASLDESFQNPTVLREVISSVMGGLRESSSPQVEAYKFRVLSRMPEYQGASFVQLKKAMEQPTPAFIKAMRSSVEGDFGTGDMATLVTKGIYSGMSTSEAERYSKGISKKVDKSLMEGLLDPEKRGGEDFGTGDISKSTAQFAKHFQETGIKIVDNIDDFSELMVGSFSSLETVIETAVKEIKIESSFVVGSISDMFKNFFKENSNYQP